MYCDWPEFGRCCFCLPLRRGVLTFGYISMFFSAFLVGIYSYSIHQGHRGAAAFARGGVLPTEACLALYCFEVVFDAILVYGAHKKLLVCLKSYYYFSVTTTVATVFMQIIDAFTTNGPGVGIIIELFTFTFAGICIQIYLIFIVRSLIKKLEVEGPHIFDNQLHQIVSGEAKVENGVYNNTTVVPNV